jgi:hypothetical protein
MNVKTVFAALLFTVVATSDSVAQETQTKTFNSGSYQQILRENAEQAFILAIWSLDCPSCLKDMRILSEVKHSHPELKIIMLSTDEPNAASEVNAMLARQHLSDLESWVFGDEDAQKLRYEIDPSWFGELPRTYFYDKTQKRSGKSGAMKIEEFEMHVNQIYP